MNPETHAIFNKHSHNAKLCRRIYVLLLFFVLTWPAFAGEVPQFIKVGQKYNFLITFNPIVSDKDGTVWASMVGYTVTEIDAKTGWITVKNAAGDITRHLNLNVVFAVESAQ